MIVKLENSAFVDKQDAVLIMVVDEDRVERKLKKNELRMKNQTLALKLANKHNLKVVQFDEGPDYYFKERV